MMAALYRIFLDAAPAKARKTFMVFVVIIVLVLVWVNKDDLSSGVGTNKDNDSRAQEGNLIEFIDANAFSFVEPIEISDQYGASSYHRVDVGTTETNPADTTETSNTSGDEQNVQVNETPDEQIVPKKRNPKVPLLPPDIVRGPFDENDQDMLRGKWGGWHFWDGQDRPPNDSYVKQYPNLDIPGDKFPDNAWQVDAVYVNHYLDAATDLVEMAKEAIFTEYGHGKPQPPEGMVERMKMFHWEKLDLSVVDRPPNAFQKRGSREIGGWTTKRSYDGLIRRLLHAMMTQDTFTVVLAGHSAAAGEGNHFRQSYMMQFHQIMEPIFERLGVKLITRNVSYGGMGTVHSSMGSRDILGSEVDLMLWDAGMTENPAQEHIDLFFRQALLAGNRVPVIWASGPFNLLRMLHEEADADVGEWGSGMSGIQEVTSQEQAEKEIPWAARYLKCDPEAQQLCAEDRFRSTCWIDRPDGVKPNAPQLEKMKAQVKWHPGWRAHQLQGRVLAFAILEALDVASNRWMDNTMTGQPLDDDYWHVTDYYENIRNKVRNLDASKGNCHMIAEKLPVRMCHTPMNGRTQYTPRANYDDTSLTSIVKAAPDGYVPRNELKPLYDGPDVHNPNFDVPKDATDVLAIVVNRRRLTSEDPSTRWTGLQESNGFTTKRDNASVNITAAPKRGLFESNDRRFLQESIVPGKGWEVFGEPQGICDGTYDATCGHSTDNQCFLSGQHMARGAIVGTEWSGWLVLQAKAVREGIIVIKLHTWHRPGENPRTNDWTSVNNEGRRGLGYNPRVDRGDVDRRHLEKYATPELPDSFVFEYAIDGQITSLDKNQFLEKKKDVQRLVETVTLLDDPNFTSEPKDVEVAVRLRGTQRQLVFGISHLYWA